MSRPGIYRDCHRHLVFATYGKSHLVIRDIPGLDADHVGLLCATMGRWSEAQQHFEQALAMNNRIGARVPLAHTQHDYAAMLLARSEAGDRERAVWLIEL
jgi:hypothetical protein